MDYPEWVTLSDLGTFPQDYNFNINPIIILFGASTGSTVTLLNGALPAGLQWAKNGNTVVLSGVCIQTTDDIVRRFTYRITQGNSTIADRTFTIKLTNIVPTVSWIGQETFLGYQNNTLPQFYQLRATSSNNEPIKYTLETPVYASNVLTGTVEVSAAINPTSGILTVDADTVINNSIIRLNIGASIPSNSNKNYLATTINVLTNLSPPIWETDAGSLGIFVSDSFIDIQLKAKDLNNLKVLYQLVDNPQNASISINEDGLLFGRISNVTSTATYYITVNATNLQGTSQRTFSLTIVPSVEESQIQWVTNSDLGSINEGQYIEIPILAKSSIGRNIFYGVSGGFLPPNLMCDTEKGLLVGYCEYHAVPKTYYFNLSATDTVQTIIKQFSLTVTKKYYNVFFSSYIPLTDNTKSQWIYETSDVSVKSSNYSQIQQINHVNKFPQLSIINGLETQYPMPNNLVTNVKPWLAQLDLQIASASNVAVSNQSSVLFRYIGDFQQGANASVYSNSLYNYPSYTNGVVYPTSIDNLRKIFKKDSTWIGAGGGNGAVLVPEINWSTGALTDINVVSTGKDYFSPPELIITGNGSNAQARAKMGITNLQIVDTGINWQIGDIIVIDNGQYKSAAIAIVEQIGENGTLDSVQIIENGDYLQVPFISNIVVNNDSAVATVVPTWGIVGTEILNPGQNYQNLITISLTGSELLPSWQVSYVPSIVAGDIDTTLAIDAVNQLNHMGLYGQRWQPNYIVFQWEGCFSMGRTAMDGLY